MATKQNVALPAELLVQVQTLAAKEGKTADELLAEAVRRDIARRLLTDLRREMKPSAMTEEQAIQAAVRAVHESRGR